jgi:signal transduction histidine kinase
MSGEAAVLAPVTKTLHIVLVEDNATDVELVQREVRRAGFDFTSVVVQTPSDFTREIKEHCPDLVLADYNLPQWNGLLALEILRRERPGVPLILVTGALGEVTAVECLKSGVTDYILKGRLTRLPVAVERALKEKELLEQRLNAEQKEREYMEELRRSNAELEQFAYIASHDLQEPLRMVASYTQLLAERYKGKLDENADKYIAYAVDGSKRMQRLIHDLLAYARTSSEAQTLKPTDASEVLARVITQLQGLIDKSGANIVCGKLPVVNVDETQLGQVFQNLIGNALKFHRDEEPQVEIRAEPSGEMWDFAVIDNGIGISQESGSRIFQMFQRLHTRQEYEGSGIGLAISKRIVERHGGRIWFDSAPGQGTTFHFTMPKSGGAKQ